MSSSEGDDADRLVVIVSGQIEAKSTAGDSVTRLIYQTGDELGVDGLLDDELTWEHRQSHLRRCYHTGASSDGYGGGLDDDPELEQSVGRLRQDIFSVEVAQAAADALAVLWLHLGRARTSN